MKTNINCFLQLIPYTNMVSSRCSFSRSFNGLRILFFIYRNAGKASKLVSIPNSPNGVSAWTIVDHNQLHGCESGAAGKPDVVRVPHSLLCGSLVNWLSFCSDLVVSLSDDYFLNPNSFNKILVLMR